MKQLLFVLPDPQDHARALAAGWLKLGIFALLAAGILSLLLVLSRTPGVQEIIPWLDFFHTALVVHVVLSVVIWFSAFAGVLWVANSRVRQPLWDKSILATAAVGAGLVALSPFVGNGNPLLNNYVPILQQPLFLWGLGIFGVGFAGLIIRSLMVAEWRTPAETGVYASIVMTAVALLALLASGVEMPAGYSGQAFYELLFWGSGHTLQFAHSLLLMVAWLWLAEATGASIRLAPLPAKALFGLMLLPVLAVPFIYLQFGLASAEHRTAFTHLMKFGGLTALPLGILAVYYVLTANRVREAGLRPQRNALYASIVLFAAGGVIGFLIHGANVVIPAHYHGSIVGVTLAFMGLTYYLLPRLGFQPVVSKWAAWQPFVYGCGQLLHILGLAWSGGYGVQRKTAGAAQGLHDLPQILGMGMMGLGGLIAIIGGGIFVVVVLRALYARPTATPAGNGPPAAQ
ncbi:cbb3-type cytochrome c oxidase subunit I [Candidatus Thiothrix sp. Deng01]|uniref:Cbb3-type cytochrome c oxidase subunit I n=1 Tax=Candidatus Thiothrix phosphatis TaxID=3112415 RepID=A0ABU6CXD6_9GAMM|nr:cbb3-type cytochrome c oxidase subunit I [Candidatus Thiothrix sp. Deng01]MEB4591489.1 cbb3-type cytochrome c oxidase subunit I [Candidatus Thiothrix sp. Deng01]